MTQAEELAKELDQRYQLKTESMSDTEFQKLLDTHVSNSLKQLAVHKCDVKDCDACKAIEQLEERGFQRGLDAGSELEQAIIDRA